MLAGNRISPKFLLTEVSDAAIITRCVLRTNYAKKRGTNGESDKCF